MFILVFTGIVNVCEFLYCAGEVALSETHPFTAHSVASLAKFASIVLASFCLCSTTALFKSFYSSIGREATATRPKFIITILGGYVEFLLRFLLFLCYLGIDPGDSIAANLFFHG